jgi:hypothetical protein
MKTVTADAMLLNAMKLISEPTEVLDQEGRIVATVYPSPRDSDDFMDRIGEVFDFEELRRLKGTDRENDRSTAEVLMRLNAMVNNK